MVKVLITGAAGQVGSELLKRAPAGFEVVGYSSEQLDITDHLQVEQLVSEVSPQVIINAAAYTAVDKAESHSEQANAVNKLGVLNLARAAMALDIPVFHISTDYVFNGKISGSYKEDYPVDPLGVYGASKLAGEKALAESGAKYFILRTSWVFGVEGSNFVKSMLRLGAERETIGIVADQRGCPTSAASIADSLWLMAKKYLSGENCPQGVYHFSNTPATSWFGFAQEIFHQAKQLSLLDSTPKLIPITTDQYPTPAKRPENSELMCQKIEQLLEMPMPEWKRELHHVLSHLKESRTP